MPGLANFVHLHVHSAYSLSEGALPIKNLAGLAIDHAMPALAITDTGNMFGALEFSEVMAGKGVQPVIGCSLMIGFGDLKQRAGEANADAAQFVKLVLLARNETGYGNLVKLTSRAWLNTTGSDPVHVPLTELQDLSDGLICLTGGPSGPLDRAISDGQDALAETRLHTLKDTFGDRLYIELQRHGLPGQAEREAGLLDLAYAHDVPLVATNEPFFPQASDFDAHDALICIAEGTVVAATDRRRLTPEHYFKSAADMSALFADLPEAIENSIEIAKRCAFRPRTRDPILPAFTTSEGGRGSEADELRRQARVGLEKRIAAHGLAPDTTLEQYQERLEFELDVIIKMDFPGYFLIVADFIGFAKDNGIPVGPGRGSGAGSLVAWALLITDLDPLRFGLLFERFLNPERVSMPDFDIDFCQDRRDEVIAYVQQKYGAEQVAQIITFGKLQARAVCRDVGRVLQMPFGQVDRLCKLIPMNPANPVSLGEAIDGEPRLREERDSSETVRQMLDIGLRLEGLYRHASTHAAGVVIGDRPLEELVPLYRDPRSTMPATQFNLKWVEPAGLVKFDFLGLKTLTVIANAEDLVRKHTPSFDIAKVDYGNANVYDMLGKGDTIGVFQLESSGMRDVLRKINADCIEDIIAIVALYRPGPMDNIPRFIACKKGEEQPDYLHERIKSILTETYGIIVYQEQVMQIAQVLSGYSLGEADLLRRAMGKKIKAEMDQQKERFVSGAVQLGVDGARADHIFELVAKFAGYGFNKSHAACYAVVAYQTAYLKANYPVEFLAASMTLDMANTDKLQVFRQEAQRMGHEIEPPSLNRSGVGFNVADGKIRYALAALKNVGRAAVEHIVDVREEGGPFLSLADFASRIDPRTINRRALESLAKSGAFDELNPNRAQVLAGIDMITALANRTSSEAESGQNDLFGGGGSDTAVEDLRLPLAEVWTPTEKLSHEFDAVGFYVSGHPLDDYASELAKLGVVTWGEFQASAIKNGARAAKLAGTVTHCQHRRARSGNAFAFAGFSDPTGQFEAICFSDTLNAYRHLLEDGKTVIVRVEAEVEGEDIRLKLNGVEALDVKTAGLAQGLEIHIKDTKPLESIAKRLPNAGTSRVRLVLQTGDGHEVTFELGEKFTISPAIRGAIKEIQGTSVVDLV